MTNEFLTSRLMARPARAVVRLVARTRLLRVVESAARIEVHPGKKPGARSLGDTPSTGDDPEAVHDFRVALRRLRSWLRVFRPYLEDTVAGKTERALGRLSRLAGEARDLEVQREWLLAAAAGPKSGLAPAVDWLVASIKRSEGLIFHRLGRSVAGKLPKAAGKLGAQVERYNAEIDVDQGEVGPRMSVVIGERILEHLALVREQLGRVQRPAQAEEAHLARISIKRLRYLLEALNPSLPPVALGVKRLGLMQQSLGDLHDAQVLAGRLARPPAKGHAKTSPTRAPFDGHFVRDVAPPAPTARQMAALRGALRGRMASAFYQAHQLSRSRETAAVFAMVARLARQLRRPPRPSRAKHASLPAAGAR